MGCQSVGKKPANLYSTKCRIFGPRTPPPVAPWWDTSSRRPHTGSRTPFSYFAINCKNEKTIFGVGFLLRHFNYILLMKFNLLDFVNKRFSILTNRSVTPLHCFSKQSSSHTKRHIAL